MHSEFNDARIVVVGTGVMGRNHARVVSQHPEAKLIGIVEPDYQRATAVAEAFGCEVFSDIRDAFNVEPDGMIVASPSHTHKELGLRAVEAGIDVLVEKPLALSKKDAEEMAQTVESRDATLMVGHIELFNPVVEELKRVIGGLTLKRIACQRLGFVADTSRLYHNVVEDLMVHDISIILQLLNNQEPEVAYAFGRKDTPADPDPADAHLIFDNDVDVKLTAGRSYNGGKKRIITVETDECVIRADLVEGRIDNITAGEGVYEIGGHTYIQNTRVGTRMPAQKEPLVAEFQHFLDCIREQKTPEMASVSARDAVRVLGVTDAILAKIRHN
jgi:predicted dehydrogenase